EDEVGLAGTREVPVLGAHQVALRARLEPVLDGVHRQEIGHLRAPRRAVSRRGFKKRASLGRAAGAGRRRRVTPIATALWRVRRARTGGLPSEAGAAPRQGPGGDIVAAGRRKTRARRAAQAKLQAKPKPQAKARPRRRAAPAEPVPPPDAAPP